MTGNKISLAVIAGNVERYMERFLNAFKPLADEIIVVRAIGNQEPDRTLDIARAHGCVVSEYLNKVACDWPHVDDFAAARNMAFNMARYPWICWADTDDVIDAESIAAIKDALGRMAPEQVALEVKYVVPEDGLTVYRERVIRNGSGKWVSPIHEHFKFNEDAHVARITNAQFLHMPSGTRAPNDERNLRILESIPADQRTNSHKFHLFQSLRAVGRMQEARNQAAVMLLDKNSGLGDAERYELFIASGQLSDDPAVRSQMMLQALGTDPSRREAYGELALCMIGNRQPDKALALTTAMRAIKQPSTDAWNRRGKYYGYLGEQLHGMALRACGRPEEADAIETNHFIRNGAKISLIHATRGRLKQAVEARRLWFNRAANPDAIEHIFGIDATDNEATYLTVHNHVVTLGTGGSVAAWNAAAAKSKGEVLVQMSDDWEPPMHWDKLILDAIGDTSKPAVLAVGDGGRSDDLLCMAIITLARYNDQGWMFHPDFFSVFSDNWFTDCAVRDGVLIDRRADIIFHHLHPAFKKAEMDVTYAHGNSEYAYRVGSRHYERLKSGAITSHDVHGWCNYRDIYAELAKAIPNGGRFVEVGSWLGQSIIHLAQRLQDQGKNDVSIGCVDTFRGEEGQIAHIPIVEAHGGSVEDAFRANIKAAGVDEMITVIVGDSAESALKVSDNSLDGCFIDAAHSYEGCKRDLEAWFAKVKDGGVWAGHDYHWHEVKRAVDEHASANGYKVQAMPGTVWLRVK